MPIRTRNKQKEDNQKTCRRTNQFSFKPDHAFAAAEVLPPGVNAMWGRLTL